MSSSASRPTWSEFAWRDELPGQELPSPVAEAAEAVRQQARELAALADAEAQTQAEAWRALAEQAVLAVQLGSALQAYEARFVDASLAREHRHFRIVKDQMLAALDAAGLEVVLPTGLPYGTVIDSVEVVGWRHAPEFALEVVAEALDPIVRHRGTLLRPARVIMGAPPQSAPPTSPATSIPE